MPTSRHLLVRDQARLSIELSTVLLRKDPPSEFRIFAKGAIKSLNSYDGRSDFVFNEASAKSVMERATKKGTDFVIDYEHQSVTTEGRAPAAGYFKLELRNGELWATQVEWTEQGVANLSPGQDKSGRRTPPSYRYFSPVFSFDSKTGQILSLTNLGLTNLPATRDMQAIAAKQHRPGSSTTSSSRPSSNTPSFAALRERKEKQMSKSDFARAAQAEALENMKQSHADTVATLKDARETAVNETAEVRAQLTEAKNTISAKDGTIAAKEAEIAALKVQASEVSAIVGKASLAEAKGAFAALKQEAEKAVATAAEMKAKVDKIEADSKTAKLVQLVDGGIADGKITPAEREAFLKADVSFVETILAVRPKIVKQEGVIPPKPAEPAAALNLDPELEATLKAIGHDPQKLAAAMKERGVPMILQ